MPSAPHYFATESESQPANKIRYQQIVAGLLFVARMTWPEATIQVNLVGWRATNPSAANMEGALNLLKTSKF
jgi:hypothetical protein